MCFIVCFITTSRVKPSLHHSTETNLAKEDTGDAPVFVSLSLQPSQMFARNKIIKGLTPLSHTQCDPNDWNVELFQTSQVRKQKGCSITLIISLLNTWADDNSERIYRNVCPQSAANPIYGLLPYNDFLKSGTKRKGEHNFSMAFLPNTWHKCRDWRPAGEESFCWLCLPWASQLLNYTITTHRAASEISLSGMSFIKCK